MAQSQISIWLLFALILFNSACASVHSLERRPGSSSSPSTASESIERVLASAQSPWASVPNSSLRFIVVEDDGRSAVAIGFEHDQLSSISSSITREGRLSWRIRELALPEIDFFTGCDEHSCGENQPQWTENQRLAAQPIAQLSKVTGQPILLTSTHISREWQENFGKFRQLIPDLSESTVFLFTIFHEMFHQHQNRINKPFEKLALAEGCFDRPEFKQVFFGYLSKWAAIISNDEPSIKDRLKTALSLNAKDEPCLDSRHYRQEGIPNYFAYAFLRDSKVLTESELNRFLVNMWLTPHDGQNQHYYDYGLGAAMALGLEAISPDKKWQRDIENGRGLEKVLRDLIY